MSAEDKIDVEGHAKRFHAAEDAEAPEDVERETAGEQQPKDERDDDDVSGHAKRFH